MPPQNEAREENSRYQGDALGMLHMRAMIRKFIAKPVKA